MQPSFQNNSNMMQQPVYYGQSTVPYQQPVNQGVREKYKQKVDTNVF